MHMKRVCIVVLSSDTHFRRISFSFGVKLMSKYFFTFHCFYCKSTWWFVSACICKLGVQITVTFDPNFGLNECLFVPECVCNIGMYVIVTFAPNFGVD